MQQLPASTVRTAAGFLAEGWSPSKHVGVLAPPNDKHSGGWHLVVDEVWQAMVLMQMAADPAKVRAA